MKPITYNILPTGETQFNYKVRDWERFTSRGYSHGDTGMLLVRRNALTHTYWGFGTIENPMTEPMEMSIIWNHLFDGPYLTNEEIINPPKRESAIESSYKMYMLDFGEDYPPNIKMYNPFKHAKLIEEYADGTSTEIIGTPKRIEVNIKDKETGNNIRLWLSLEEWEAQQKFYKGIGG